MITKKVILILDNCYLCPHYEEFDIDYKSVSCYCYYDKYRPIQLKNEDIISLSKCKLKEYKE